MCMIQIYPCKVCLCTFLISSIVILDISFSNNTNSRSDHCVLIQIFVLTGMYCVWCGVHSHHVDVSFLCLQSEEDKQLMEELNMLVERLKVIINRLILISSIAVTVNDFISLKAVCVCVLFLSSCYLCRQDTS